MRSIRTKILVVVIAGLLILTTIISGVVMYATNKILERNADQLMRSESEREAAKINDMLGGVEKSIQVVSEAAVDQLGSVDFLKIQSNQQQYTRDMELLFTNAARNTTGMIAYYFRYNPDLDLPDVGFFYGLTTQTNELQKLPVTDLSGNRDNIIWWKEPTSAKRPVWIAPHYHSDSDLLMVSYVAPVYKDSKLVGVVGIDIQFSSLVNAVNQIAPYENGYAYLLSRTGEELYHPYEAVRSQVSDKDIITATALLDNGMTLVVCAHYNDIQNQANRMMVAMFLTSMGLVLISIFLAFIMANKLTQPLRRLASAAGAIGEGKELEVPECELNDEIGVLYNVLKDSNTRLNEYMSDVKAKAYRDALTGLRNRASYSETVKKLEERISNETASFGVVVLDVNNLKVVNDTHSHECGDELLVRVAKLIASVFRRSHVYRIGGDEFVVLLEDLDYEERNALMEELGNRCRGETIEFDGEKIPVSIAFGLAVYNKDIDSGYENVFHRADGAMYRHKREIKGI